MDRRQIRKGDVDSAFDQADVIVQGVYRPAAIEHFPLETQISLSVPEPDGRLTIYSCTQAMYFSHRSRRGAPSGSAEQAQARGRYRRRRLRGQGGHGDGDADCAARAQVRAAREVALHARGGVPLLVDTRRLAHRDRGRAHEGRLDPRPEDADDPRLRRLRAFLALRPDEALVPPRRRVHRAERPLRRLRRLHESRADDRHARLRRHVGVVRGRDPHEPDREGAGHGSLRAAPEEREPHRRHHPEHGRPRRSFDRAGDPGGRRGCRRRARRRAAGDDEQRRAKATSCRSTWPRNRF